MLLTLVITLLLVGAAVIGSIYSNFLTFFSNFAETENYNKAYYASIAALERAELVIKQRKPGYVGSGGWKSKLTSAGTFELSYTGSILKKDSSDGTISNFSYLSSGNSRGTNIFWSINSRTSQVPGSGKGNIDWMLITGDSANYNMMDYETSETFLLYYDDWTGNAYSTSGKIVYPTTITQITGTIRLSPYLTAAFSGNKLDTGNSLSVTGVKDDAIVDWQLMGRYGTGQFTVYSYQDIVQNKPRSRDTAIRESNINNDTHLEFYKYRSPIIGNINRDKGEATVISPLETQIKQLSNKYKDIFSHSTNLQLKLSLLNLLQSTQKGIIYPFLEYQLNFGTPISDKYFKIEAEGKFDNFQVDTIIHRPTIKESVLGDFTVIF